MDRTDLVAWALGRYRVFELDVFSADLAPLTLIEVGIASVEATAEFSSPMWFGNDVTDDKCLKSKALATKRLPDF